MPRLVTSFDSVVLAAVARDVTALVGSRVVRVTQPAPEEVALAVRGPSGTATILSSIDPRWARIHLASPSASGEPSAFAQQLRSRLESATLAGVRQPPFERILTLTFETDRGLPQKSRCGQGWIRPRPRAPRQAGRRAYGMRCRISWPPSHARRLPRSSFMTATIRSGSPRSYLSPWGDCGRCRPPA